MSVESKVRAVTTLRLKEMKDRGEKIAMLTSYDYSMAKIVDAAGVDVILVGDSAANVMAGYETTVPITLDAMIYHARSVVRAVERALVVVDLPFGTYQGNSKMALDSAIRIMKETEADAVKLEGGEEILESVERILTAGIPIMGHLGLTPQSIHKFGTYTVRAREEAEAEKLVRDARLLEEAGCFAVVLEKIPRRVGRTRVEGVVDSHDRHRRRRRHRRAGARDPRHAGHQQGLFAPLPAPLRRPAYGDDRCGGAVRRRCQVAGLSQRAGAVLTGASVHGLGRDFAFSAESPLPFHGFSLLLSTNPKLRCR